MAVLINVAQPECGNKRDQGLDWFCDGGLRQE